MVDFPWRQLLQRVTAAERERRAGAEYLWRSGDIRSIRALGIADGLALARDIHAQVIADQRGGTLEFDPLSRAMHSVWLHGKWRWLTENMDAEEREAAADAVQAYSDYLNDEDGPKPLTGLRWWRNA